MAADPGRTGGPDRLQGIDWEAIERSPEFQELVQPAPRFVMPATIFFLTWYMGFIAARGLRARLHGRARLRRPDRRLLLALTQFLMVLVLGHLVPAQGRPRVRPARRARRRAGAGDGDEAGAADAASPAPTRRPRDRPRSQR